jgi:hypothetical protein
MVGSRALAQQGGFSARVRLGERMTQVSQELMKNRTKGGFESYGELLYAEGMEKQRELERLTRVREAEREAEELRELSLRPAVSKGTQRMMATNPVPLWDRLQDAKLAKEKEARLQAEREVGEAWGGGCRECAGFTRVLDTHPGFAPPAGPDNSQASRPRWWRSWRSAASSPL